MRPCPLLSGLEIPCPPERPLCPWCVQQAEEKTAVGLVTLPAALLTPPARQRPPLKRKPCAVCRAYFRPRSPRHTYCETCGLEHSRSQNAEHQRRWRARRKLRKQIAAKRRPSVPNPS
jgi:hypothetical protein